MVEFENCEYPRLSIAACGKVVVSLGEQFGTEKWNNRLCHGNGVVKAAYLSTEHCNFMLKYVYPIERAWMPSSLVFRRNYLPMKVNYNYVSLC
jgi:hypothetical protein